MYSAFDGTRLWASFPRSDPPLAPLPRGEYMHHNEREYANVARGREAHTRLETLLRDSVPPHHRTEHYEFHRRLHRTIRTAEREGFSVDDAVVDDAITLFFGPFERRRAVEAGVIDSDSDGWLNFDFEAFP